MQVGQMAAAAEEVHGQVDAGVEAAQGVHPAAGKVSAGLVGGRAARLVPTPARWPRAARHAAKACLALRSAAAEAAREQAAPAGEGGKLGRAAARPAESSAALAAGPAVEPCADAVAGDVSLACPAARAAESSVAHAVR